MIYLWGGSYKSISELGRENYKQKLQIQQRFGTEENFLRQLPLPDRLSGVVHMATGTGKSYVIFAIAWLSLIMGLTKRVLVLGPASTIIEQGLREKFKELICIFYPHSLKRSCLIFRWSRTLAITESTRSEMVFGLK